LARGTPLTSAAHCVSPTMRLGVGCYSSTSMPGSKQAIKSFANEKRLERAPGSKLMNTIWEHQHACYDSVSPCAAPDKFQRQALMSQIQAQVASGAQHNTVPLCQVSTAADGALNPTRGGWRLLMQGHLLPSCQNSDLQSMTTSTTLRCKRCPKLSSSRAPILLMCRTLGQTSSQDRASAL
jgi:hypothetical protein